MQRFTERMIERLALPPGRKDRLLFDGGCPGLGLRVTPKSKVFLVQWTCPATKAKVREPLGVHGALSIDQARDAARVRLGQVAKGINPRAERMKARAEAERTKAEDALSLDGLITEWASLHLANRRPRHAAEAERALRSAFTDLTDRPAARVGKADVLGILDRLSRAGSATMAARTLAYGRAAYAWAGKRGMVACNPFQGLPLATATLARERVLSDAETKEVWAAASGMAVPFGPAIRFLMLTMARRDEVAAMAWSEVATDGCQWVIPSARTKNGKPHVVHLPAPARTVLAGVKQVKGQDLVFSTTGRTPISGWSKAKTTLDAAVKKARAEAAKATGTPAEPMPGWTYHDFRRTGVTFLASKGFDPVVADKLLNHQPAQLRGVAAVYQRYSFDEERAKALDAWAQHVASDVVAMTQAG